MLFAIFVCQDALFHNMSGTTKYVVMHMFISW